RRIGQRNARLWLCPNDRCHPGVALVERFGSWKQRSSVTVLAEAKQCHVEEGPLRIEYLASIKVLQGFLVQCGGFFGCPGSRQDRVNLRKWNRHLVNEGFPGHPVIAVLVIHGHKTFVAPEQMELPPIERNAQIPSPEQLIDPLRGRTAGKA